MADFELSLNRILERLDRLESLAESAPRVPAIGGVDGEDLAGDTGPVIDSETPTVGTSALLMRDDTVGALKLAGTPGDQESVAEPVQTLGFCKKTGDPTRWGLGIIFGTHTVGVNHYPSLEGEQDAGGTDGTRVKLGNYATSRAALDVQSDGVGVPLSPTGAIVDTGSGPEVNIGDGLDIDANAVKAKADADADNILAISGSGVLVKALASTSKRGLMLQASSPPAGLRNIPAIDNAESAWKVEALFDATNPANLGTASPGTAMVAARRDHVHEAPSSAPDVETDDLGGSDHTMTTGTWEDVLSLTAPGSNALVWANFGADLSPVAGQITYDSGGGDTKCADVGDGSGRSGSGFAIVTGGATVKLQINDGGVGRTIYAAETWLAAMAF